MWFHSLIYRQMTEGQRRGSNLPWVVWRTPHSLNLRFKNVGPPPDSGHSRSKRPVVSWTLYQLPQAVVTNFHKRSGLQQTQVYSCRVLEGSVCSGSAGLCSSWKLWRRICFLALPASHVCPGSWLMPCVTPTSDSVLPSPPLALSLLPPLIYNDHCDYFGPAW